MMYMMMMDICEHVTYLPNPPVHQVLLVPVCHLVHALQDRQDRDTVPDPGRTNPWATAQPSKSMGSCLRKEETRRLKTSALRLWVRRMAGRHLRGTMSGVWLGSLLWAWEEALSSPRFGVKVRVGFVRGGGGGSGGGVEGGAL